MIQTNEIKSMIADLLKAEIPENQSMFIKSLHKWFNKTGTLSEKQIACLKSMYDQAESKKITN